MFRLNILQIVVVDANVLVEGIESTEQQGGKNEVKDSRIGVCIMKSVGIDGDSSIQVEWGKNGCAQGTKEVR